MTKRYWEADPASNLEAAHDGWYLVAGHDKLPTDVAGPFVKAKSAFEAASKCGYTLAECTAVPITDQETIARLEEEL